MDVWLLPGRDGNPGRGITRKLRVFGTLPVIDRYVNLGTVGIFGMTATMAKKAGKARLDFFCSEEQRDRYSAAAELEGRPLAQWIRFHLDKAVARSGVESGEHLPKLPKKGE